MDLNTAEVFELAALVRATVSAFDRELTLGSQCERVLCPLVEHAAQHAGSNPFTDVAEFDNKITNPELMGASDLRGLDVRTTGGINPDTGETWPGLMDLAFIDVDPSPLSCCVGGTCTGADYTCENEALVEAPTACSPAP